MLSVGCDEVEKIGAHTFEYGATEQEFCCARKKKKKKKEGVNVNVHNIQESTYNLEYDNIPYISPVQRGQDRDFVGPSLQGKPGFNWNFGM